MEKEEKKNVSVKDEFGKFLLDLAKLAFASLVLGTVVRGGINDYVLLFVGLVVTLLCCFLWLVTNLLFEEGEMNATLFVMLGVMGPCIIFAAGWLIVDYIKERRAAAK